MRSAHSPGRVGYGLLLASLLALPGVASPTEAANRREQARLEYERAARMRTALDSKPASARSKADYTKLIQAFKAVYHTSPAYGNTPAALAAVGEIYREMARVFAAPTHYQDSIKAYEFLAREYPYNHLSRDALYTVGEIYDSDLKSPEEARKAFQELIQRYPKSDQARAAQETLREIDLLLAERARGRATPTSSSESERQRERTPEVTDIRRWVGPNYSRIVIAVDGEAKFDTMRLSNPDRIVLDLSGTRLGAALVGKSFPVEDGFLRAIRVAQFTPSVTRVVLDVGKVEDYSIFSLPNPFRLVVDIHGVPPPAAEGPLTARKSSGSPRTGAPTPDGSRASTKTSSASPQAAVAAAREPSTPRAVTTAEARNGGGKIKPPSESGKSSQEQPAGAKETASAKASSLPPASRTPEATAPTGPGNEAAPKPAAPTESGSRTLTRALGLKVARIVIDPGHGGHDTGTIGPTGLQEKEVVLDVALRLQKLLEAHTDSEVILTRSDDTFIPLEERTALANQKAADLLISIHANASRSRSARGIETYYLNFTSDPEALEVAARENATSQESVYQLRDLVKRIVLTEKVEESYEFATHVQRQVRARLGEAKSQQPDRGVKKAPFVVLIGANMPSVLTEISFLSNPRDERLLKRPDYRQKLAQGLYEGVARYVSALGTVQAVQKARLGEAAVQSYPLESASPSSANF